MIKKLLFIFLLQLSFATFVCAQTREKLIAFRDSIATNTDKFLTVKGVELKPMLRMDEALKMFEAKGWKKSPEFDEIKNESGEYSLDGDFFNKQDCYIYIVPTKNNKDIVGRVLIIFPKWSSFYELKNEYDELKSSLNHKYTLNYSNESFNDKYLETSSSDALKLDAISNNEAVFETWYNISDKPENFILGNVNLKIIYIDNISSYNVSLMYVTSDDLIDYISAEDDL